MRLAVLFVAMPLLAFLFGARADARPPKGKHSHRYLVAVHVNRGLAGTPLQGLGFAFETAGWKHDVSPYFLVGASGPESSLGAAGCSGNPKNIWGLAACDGRWPVPFFETWREAIGFYAAFIKRTWPRARTLYELHGYCPPCGSYGWGSKTLEWMRRLFGDVSSALAYPREARR